MDPSVGELAVSHELDVLNHRFQALLNMLIDQLKNLASVNTDDLELQVSKIILIMLTCRINYKCLLSLKNLCLVFSILTKYPSFKK